MSGIIGGVIDFNNKEISENLKDSMIETINLYKVDNIDYILKNNYLMTSGQIFITEENKMVEISTSILSVKKGEEAETFFALEKAKTDYFHIDVMEIISF